MLSAPTPHQLGPTLPFAYPPNTYHLMDYFPLGVNPPHFNLLVHEDPAKFGMEFTPDVIVNCHPIPCGQYRAARKWFDFLRSMRFIVCVDLIPTEMTDWRTLSCPPTMCGKLELHHD